MRVIVIDASEPKREINILQELKDKLNIIEPLNAWKKEPIIFDLIVKKLKEKDKTIVIDESEYLSPKALDLLRYLHQKTGVTVVLWNRGALVERMAKIQTVV